MVRDSCVLGDAEYVGTFAQGSPEWHEQRAQVIGSSDIAPILGLSSYKSAFTLWHEKAGLVEPRVPDERWQNKLDYGHHMEPFVAGKFMKANPEYLLQETGSWRSVRNPWQGCNPDRLVHLSLDRGEIPTANAVVELKTFPSLSDWADGPTPGYVAQLFWQLDVFGFQRGWIAGYANLSGDYVQYEFEPDPFMADAVRAKARAFADSITEGTPPEIDGSDGTYQTVRRLNPSITPKEEAVIPDEIAERYLEAAKSAKASESELFKWKGHLLAHMGTAQYALYEGKKIASRIGVKDGVPYLKEAS
jgi:putative phage-type endonuclease